MSNFDPMDTHRQEQERESRELDARLKRETEEADIRWLMSCKQGRRIVWRLLESAGVYRLSYVQSDALTTAFNEGKRNGGLKLMAQVHALCPELYPVMVKEAHDADDRPGSDR